jgi:DNA-binding response OmpR family regulator
MPADNRVLLLDTRPAERGRLAASISQLGYVAFVAEDIAATQANWEREAFPIVIVDVGDQLARIAELHVQLPRSAIITIGARALAAALSAWNAGADGYLPRPVRQNELAAALAHALHTPRSIATPQPESSASAEFRRMAAELARQINTPLAPILGMIDLLSEELPAEHPGQQYAQAITAAALRIRDVAWMLADIARQKE